MIREGAAMATPVSLAEVEIARGHLEYMMVEPTAVTVSGWLMLAEQPFDSYAVVLDGRVAEIRPPVERPEIAGSFPWIGHAGRCGFRFRVPVESPLPERMDIIGYSGDRPAGRLTTLLRSDFGTAPLPPMHLIQRVIGAPAADFFRADGLKVYSDFKLTMRRHGYPNDVPRMLDCGCGCGRTAVYFLADGNVRDFHGCDIDAEAVGWCRPPRRVVRPDRIRGHRRLTPRRSSTS